MGCTSSKQGIPAISVERSRESGEAYQSQLHVDFPTEFHPQCSSENTCNEDEGSNLQCNSFISPSSLSADTKPSADLMSAHDSEQLMRTFVEEVISRQRDISEGVKSEESRVREEVSKLRDQLERQELVLGKLVRAIVENQSRTPGFDDARKAEVEEPSPGSGEGIAGIDRVESAYRNRYMLAEQKLALIRCQIRKIKDRSRKEHMAERYDEISRIEGMAHARLQIPSLSAGEREAILDRVQRRQQSARAIIVRRDNQHNAASNKM